MDKSPINMKEKFIYYLNKMNGNDEMTLKNIDEYLFGLA